jgi:hypothetical protein
MKKIIISTFFVLVGFAFLVSCGGSEGSGEGGSGYSGGNSSRGIYGHVTDFATGEDVANANVQLRPSGETTLTGSDGMFEFRDLTPGDYKITVSKVEYEDLIDDYPITVKDKMMRRDIQIRKIKEEVAYLDILDNDGNPLPNNTLDFGRDFTSRQFQIYNAGPKTIDCTIITDGYSAEWVTSVSLQSPLTVKIEPGEAYGAVATINRSKLAAGQNRTTMQVTTSNGNKELILVATRDADTPIVRTLPVKEATESNGYSDKYYNILSAEVTAVGNPAYTERGFCYSSSNPTPDMQSGKCEKDSEKGVKGKYEFSIWECDKTQYYVTAYLKWNGDYIYGNVESFVWKGGDNGSGDASECTSGQYKCDGSYSYYCFAGNWDQGEYCSKGCNSSTGMCAECASGEYECDGYYSLYCSGGRWNADDYCIDGCDSSTGKCKNTSGGGGNSGNSGDCSDIYDCYYECEDSSCVYSCIGTGSSSAQSQFWDLLDCWEDNSCEYTDCDECYSKYSACVE